MNEFTDLLRKAADEIRNYCRVSPDAQSFGIDFLQALADRMEIASSLESEAKVEQTIDALAHAIVDSGPLTEQFAPSFDRALDALQRLRKHRAKP
ncbi:MAG: hypothetical protein KF843_02940 [Flavobacteriales bacterium]|nr:hypothetical protein [Flavobacteriales bacterium]